MYRTGSSSGGSGRRVPARAAARLRCFVLLAGLASCACFVDAGQAALPASSGGRRLLACAPFAVEIENECTEPIEVAVVAQLSEDVAPGYCNNTATKAGEWCTRLWFPLAANESTTAFASVTLAEAYTYARTTSMDGPGWGGSEYFAGPHWFNIVTGEPCEASSSSSYCKPFLPATSSSCPDSTWTAQTFDCPACDVFFQNNCSLPVQLAVNFRLFDNEAPDFCAGVYRRKGDRCTRTGLTLAPGVTTSQALAQVYFNSVWYWASATDASNRSVDWVDEADEDTDYIDLVTGDLCNKGDASTCKPFQKARCGNITLSCPALPDCTIPHCQTYTPDGPGCVCGTCGPGYSGSQCTACSVAHCDAYRRDCYCHKCSSGYEASDGSCVECNVANCKSYSSDSSSECYCGACETGYQASGGSCAACDVSNCETYSSSSSCYCGTCKAGYQASSGSCTACDVSHCETYSSSSECYCSKCTTGYRASGGSCAACDVSHCESYSSTSTSSSECYCSKCEAGYEASGGSCTECDISDCEIYSSSSECHCIGCTGGFEASGGSCVACNGTGCLEYSSAGCYCRKCKAGYRQSGGYCTACNVTGCQTYSTAFPYAECTCDDCAPGFTPKGPIECTACQNHHCQTYGSSCYCSACEAGYRYVVDDCIKSSCVLENCQFYNGSAECACKQCRSGWEQSPSGACISLKSSSTGVIAGAAVGAAVAVAVAATAAVFLIRRRRRKRTQAPAPPADGGEKGALDTFLPSPPGVPHGAYWGSGSGSNDNGNVQSFPTAPHSSPSQSYRSLFLQPTGTGSNVAVAGTNNAAVAASDGSAAPATAASSAYNAGTASELATLPPVQEDLADGPLATFPTRPAGLPPTSLASLQAGIVTAAMVAPGLGSQPSTAAGSPTATTPHPGASSAGSAPHSPLHSAGSAPRSPAPSAGPSPRSSLLVPPTASSVAPGTPSAPSHAGAASLTSVGTSGAELLSRDPLISYFQSQLPSSPGASGALQGRRSSGGVELRPWEVRFGDLVFLKPVGEGSYGRVYLAEWAATQVAVKVLIGGQLASSGEVQRALALSAPIQQKLEAEASLLASLRHPHVVNFMAICHEPPCIVTEYCARGSLAEVLAVARADPAVAAHLTWPRRLAMAADAAAGMLYLHTRPAPIVHRDLKSPNLLVDESWHCKVTDLNLSKILEDTTHSTSMAAMNPRWLAPELMRGQRATPASDVFSFGVVLHELLTWQLPWGAANPWQLASRVMAGERLEVPPREALPGPDAAAFAGLDGYVALMQHCWAQAPEDRPSFQDIVVALRELMEQAGGAAV